MKLNIDVNESSKLSELFNKWYDIDNPQKEVKSWWYELLYFFKK